MATFALETNQPTSPFLFALPSCNLIAAPASLVEAVQTAVQRIQEFQLQSIAARASSPAFQPRVMLAVLTYCFARQVYAASDILDYLIRDDAFSRVCQCEFPNVRELESFRRQNRSILESCLNSVLLFLANQKVSAGFITRVDETIIAGEAKRRIIMAACLNGLELAYEHQPGIAA